MKFYQNIIKLLGYDGRAELGTFLQGLCAKLSDP